MTTGLARAKHSHCQNVNCSAGIIESSTTGDGQRERAPEPTTECFLLGVGGELGRSAGVRPQPIDVGSAGGAGGKAS